MKEHERGFSLIELMIVVAVVGILAAVAYPSYREYVIRSNRNVAKSDLMELQQWLERNYTLTNNYDLAPDGTAVTLPFTQSPKSGGPLYVVGFDGAATASSYSLKAVPVSGSVQAGDSKCGTLTITSAGVKSVSGSDTVENCWER